MTPSALPWRRTPAGWTAGPYTVRYVPALRRWEALRDGVQIGLESWRTAAMNVAERDWVSDAPTAPSSAARRETE